MLIKFTGDEIKAILLRAAVERSIGLEPIASQTMRLSTASADPCETGIVRVGFASLMLVPRAGEDGPQSGGNAGNASRLSVLRSPAVASGNSFHRSQRPIKHAIGASSGSGKDSSRGGPGDLPEPLRNRFTDEEN